MASLDTRPLAAARYHGDQAVTPGMLDFAVNVRHAQPPEWLMQRLAARLPDLARYPSADDVHRAQDAVAERHGRARDEVLPLAGAAEGFALLPNLRPELAAVIAPSFTEPAAVLTAAGVPVHHVVLEPPFGLGGAVVPEDADLVIVGNPTNPTAVLHTREQLLALRRPGRILVIDEAFADSVPGEPESLAAASLPDVLVLRSLTKTWSLAGLRVGYALGSPELLVRLTTRRAHWPLGTLQLTAIAACCAPGAVADAATDAAGLVALRAQMAAGLQTAGASVVEGWAPFVLFSTPGADLIRKHLQNKGIAVRRCDTFVGLDERYLRAAVRPEWPLLVEAIAEDGGEAPVSVRLTDVIEVLDEAYPPRLAQSWDSVGLVCGDPEDVLDSVTVAVDATAAVVDEVPDNGLLLAHHPLLLRGVDTVAASTPKGALVHRLIRTGRSLFTAHTNADSAAPGVSDALAHALGLTVEGVLEPLSGTADLDKWVVYVPREHAEAVQAAVFEAGAGQIGDYSHCSWSVTGIGQFLPHDGASPAIGSVGTVERVPEDRFEVIAPARARAAVLAAMRAAHPYEEPAFDIFALVPIPTDAGLGRIGTLAQPEPLSAFVSRVGAALPQTSWGVRAAGDPDMLVSKVAVCGGAGDSLLGVAAASDVQAYVTADLRHHPADEHGRASNVALIDVAHWASEFPWCEQAADVLRARFGTELPVRVCTLRTDPWTMGRNQ